MELLPIATAFPAVRAPRRWRLSLPLLLGLCAVAAVRLATLPQGPWEEDEVLFLRGVERFAPAEHRPHPPGYPLLIGLGKVFATVAGDPFRGLVALSVVASLVGFAALASAFRDLAIGAGLGAGAPLVGLSGALLFHFSPAMLVYGPLALSDPAALMFLSLLLAAAVSANGDAVPCRGPRRDRPAPFRGLGTELLAGGAAAAAVGCRPQLLPAVAVTMLVVLWRAPGRRSRAAIVFAGVVVGLCWLVPLVWACGGPRGLWAAFSKQAAAFEQFDAAVPRAGGSLSTAGWIATRFLAHPWGTRLTSVPVLLLACGGVLVVCRRCFLGTLPVLVLAGTELLIGLLTLHPADAVRYALPSLLGVAGAAALGLAWLGARLERPALPIAATVLLATGFLVYSGPLLAVRSRETSPAMAAVAAASRRLPTNAVVLAEPSLAPFASEFLVGPELALAGPGLDRFALDRSRPLWLLGDGPSGWPGALTFAWAAGDPYGKLTRGVLGVVSLSPVPSEFRQVRGVSGVLVHEPTLRQSRYRWLARQAVLELAPDGSRNAEIVLALPRNVPWPNNRVSIEIAGAAVASVDLPRGQVRAVLVALPAASRVLVSLHSERSFVAAESGLGSDRRALAVQLQELHFSQPDRVSSPPPAGEP